MQLKIGTPCKAQGNVLVVTLLTCLLIGFGLASYLVLVSSQNYSVMRSLAWNAALPMVEAGFEEGLTQVHYNGITNLSQNHWALVSSPYGPAYYKQRRLGTSYYEVYILPVEPPVLYSFGYVEAPLAPVTQVGAIMASLFTDESYKPRYIRRGAKVHTKKDPLFAKAMVAEGQIDLLGRNIETDSFDSTPGSGLNSFGKYDPALTSHNGDVATNSGLTNSLNVGNASIKGHIATGPKGSVAIGPNGSVGDSAWVDNHTKGVKPGWSTDDMNVHFKEVKEPYRSGYVTPSGGTTADGTSYDYILGNNRYLLSDFEGKVLVTGDAVMYVTHWMEFTGNDVIQIQPGASLRLYVAAPEVLIGGNGVLNLDGNALSFQYYGLPQNQILNYQGNGEFTGVIYAPDTDFYLGGGGKGIYDFIGASVTATVQMNGHYKFHYDEALAKKGPIRDYIVDSWNEL